MPRGLFSEFYSISIDYTIFREHISQGKRINEGGSELKGIFVHSSHGITA